MFSNINNDIANLVGNESHRDCDDILTDPRNLVRVFFILLQFAILRQQLFVIDNVSKFCSLNLILIS